MTYLRVRSESLLGLVLVIGILSIVLILRSDPRQQPDKTEISSPETSEKAD